MAGNAHHTRPRSKPCLADCKFCKERPLKARDLHLYRNTNGHRHNGGGRKRQKKNKQALQIKLGVQ